MWWRPVVLVLETPPWTVCTAVSAISSSSDEATDADGLSLVADPEIELIDNHDDSQ